MKQRIYSINGKTLVKGDVNDITENEILVREDEGSISLTTRTNGKAVELSKGSDNNILLAYPLELLGRTSTTKILPLNSKTAKIENFFHIIKVPNSPNTVELIASSAPTLNVYDNVQALHSSLWNSPGANIASYKLGDYATTMKKTISYNEFFKPNVEECNIKECLYGDYTTTRQIIYPLDSTIHIAPTMLWYTSASNVFRKGADGYIILTRDDANTNVDKDYLHYIFYTQASANELHFDSRFKDIPSRVIVCPLFDMSFRLSTIDDIPTLTAYAKVNMQHFREFFKLPNTYKDKYNIGDTITLEIQ